MACFLQNLLLQQFPKFNFGDRPEPGVTQKNRPVKQKPTQGFMNIEDF